MTARRRALSGQALAVAVGLSLVATGCSSKSSTPAAAGGSTTPAATSGGAAPATSGGAAPAATNSGNAPVVASASAPASGGTACTAAALGYPKVDIKGTKVGFSQSEAETAAFRIAETKSMKDEAAKQGAVYLHTDANGKTDQQVTDIKSLINQGAKLLIVAPITSDGLQPAFDAAKAAKVPVVTVDRLVNAKACTDYLTFIGSNFVSQGTRAADAMIKATGGKGKIAILLGSSGNGVTTDRTKGFVDEVKAKAPGLTIVKQQTANFARTDGQTVAGTILSANPDLAGIYAENDEMGVGAHAAILAAGKKPGKDVKIISVDGIKDAVSLIVKGEYNGVIQSNPRFGELAFKALADFESGTAVPAKIVIVDDEYTPENAAAKVSGAF